MIKQWIVKTFFQSYLDETLRQASMDAFKKAHDDVLETMRDDVDKQSEELATKKLETLLSGIDWNKVVTIDKTRGMVYIGGVKADATRLANLKAEAEFFTNSDLWSVIQESAKDVAQKTMFVSSESLVDMQKGKSMLYTLSQQKNIIDVFKSFIPK